MTCYDKPCNSCSSDHARSRAHLARRVPCVPVAPWPNRIMALRMLIAAAGRRACGSQQMLPVVCNAIAQPLQELAAAAQQQQPPSLLELAQTGFHTSTAQASAAQTLASVLSKEIKHEKTVYERDELVAKGPPAPFLLHSALGDTAVSLTRDYQGEKISIDCSVNMQESLAGLGGLDDEGEEEDEEVDDVNDVNFNVTVTRGDKALVFECISDGTYVDIKHVSLEPAEGLESETAYTGPVFPELDSELQGAFRDFLTERGVSEDLGEYLRHLMFDKEQQEYMHWLESVKGFVSSS